MYRELFTRERRFALSALGAAAVLGLASSTVQAQATGDGWGGPEVVTDQVLDGTLHALNHHIQDKYAQEEMLAALTEPQAPDFATAAIASAAAPTIVETPPPGAFGYRVFDDVSLNNGLALFNTEVALRGTDLFIQVALEATSKGDAFTLAAKGAGLDEQMAEYRQELATVSEGFGETVGDGATLDKSVVTLNQRLRDQVEREIQLAAAVPPVESASFAAFTVAIAISY